MGSTFRRNNPDHIGDYRGFIAYGVLHIKAITTTGGQILGECELHG